MHCEHILDSGRRCQTPPVKGQPFCYFHGRLHASFVLPGHPHYVPPLLDSPHSIHIAIRHVYLALSKSLLDRRSAATMLYALQLAQCNAPKGLLPDEQSVQEVTPAMQQALGLDDTLEDQRLHHAEEENAPCSTDTAPRVNRLLIGVNKQEPVVIDDNNDLEKALQRSQELWSNEYFSPYKPPDSLPELDAGEWLKITRDLPLPSEIGTAQQQVNCARALQVMHRHEWNRRMAGLK